MSEFAGRAYVLARIERNEADVSVQLLLDTGAVQWVTAKNAARSTKRFSAGLSPLTRYKITIERSGTGGTRQHLQDATVDRAYLKLIAELRKMTAALVIGAVARALGGELTEDDGLYVRFEQSLEMLEEASSHAVSGAEIVRFSVDALMHGGHGVLRSHCVVCMREAPMERSVQYHSDSGGVRCASCGGGPFVLKSQQRLALEQTLAGDSSAFAPWMLRWIAYMLGAQFHHARESVERVISYWTEPAAKPTAE